MSIVYFAHSYRERDARIVDFFARLIRSEGLTLSLDPPSDLVNGAKLQRHINSSDGMIAVLSRRPEGTSPHILFEINLAVKSGTPLLVFVEDTIVSDTVSRQIPQQRFSWLWYLREVREHRHVLRAFKNYLHEYSPPRFRPATSKRLCILTGLEQVSPEIGGALQTWITDGADYETAILMNSGSDRFKSYEMLRNANLAVALQGGRLTYTDGLLGGICIPTITLSWEPITRADPWPPPEYLPREVAPGGTGVLELSREFALYEEDFLDLPDQHAVDRYTAALVDLQGVYTESTRENVQEFVMGDKYIASGQVGAVGPNAHVHDVSFQQAWTSFSAQSEQDDLAALGAELELLRKHLRDQAQSREQDAEVAEIGAAATAAESGDGPRALSHLSKVGAWALGAATTIGTGLAGAAIKAALGL